MAEMAKFLFDTVFDTEQETPGTVSPRPEKTFWSTNERDTARNEGYERGRQAGIEETNATIAARTAAALETIATGVSALTGQLESQRKNLKSEGIVLAGMIARSLAASLIAREPLHEIETLFGEALNFLPDTPHIAVRLNEEVLESARDRLDTIAAERGFQGKLIFLAQSDIAPGDCRIEWAQGGIIKDHKLVDEKIRKITRQHIDASFAPEDPGIGPDNPSDQIETAGLREER